MTDVASARPATIDLAAAIERYQSQTPRSRQHFAQATQALAGGTTRTTVFFEPYPPVMVRGQGCWIEDLDGNRRIDFLANYTSLILGHAHPAVNQAVIQQVERGSAFAAPTPNELRLAQLISSRVKSVERLRFTNSGTEATLFAMRLARAATGRDKILIFEGGYHGTHDYAAARSSAGIPEVVRGTVVSAPYNDVDAVARVVRETGDDLAGIIIEPYMGGAGIPARADFLHGLRELTQRNGSLLILDEVISLRLAPGGAQETFGVVPDLTTMGKIIGGGYPVAAFGGRADLMALLDPRATSGPAIPHGGTFNGNPVGAAAGIATLELLTPDVYARLNQLGDQLRARLNALFERLGVAAQVTGMGSLFNVHFCREPITDYASSRAGANAQSRAAILALLNEGVMLAPRGLGCICTPMGEGEIDALESALERVLTAQS